MDEKNVKDAGLTLFDYTEPRYDHLVFLPSSAKCKEK